MERCRAIMQPRPGVRNELPLPSQLLCFSFQRTPDTPVDRLETRTPESQVSKINAKEDQLLKTGVFCILVLSYKASREAEGEPSASRYSRRRTDDYRL